LADLGYSAGRESAASKGTDMKALVLVTAIAATVALVVAPADAASKKRKNAHVTRAPVTTPHPNAVYDADGTILGVDPDPFIRLMIRRDPRPWDSDF